jgi:N4-bis(aminopropyl)spermidine synthase
LAEAAVIVRDVADAVGLAEGEVGVRAVVSALVRLEPVAIRRISRTVELPVPIVASICGELRKRDVVSEERPAQLTAAGRALFAGGALRPPHATELRTLRRRLKEIADAAPPPAVALDQCHCTLETKLRRVVALHEADALVGRRILLLGDDDLTSVAIRLFVERFGSERTIEQLTVVDVDSALVGFLRDTLRAAPFPTACVVHDLRAPLPPGLRGAFDTVLTDPPYTTPAGRLFLSRAAAALAAPGASVFLSFGSRRPGVSFALQQAITESGFAIRGLVRDFNEYVGAGVLGGTSHLYHLTATRDVRPLVEGRYDGPLYTADAPA